MLAFFTPPQAIVAYSLAGKWKEARNLALQWREHASPSPAPGDGDDAAAAAAGVDLGIASGRPPPPPTSCNTAILKAMGKAGEVAEALAWLEDTYNAAAAAAAAAGGVATGGGGGSSSLEQGEGIPFPVGLDHSSFIAVLSACSKAGRWESALAVLKDMDRAGVTPETVAFNTVLGGEIKKKKTKKKK